MKRTSKYKRGRKYPYGHHINIYLQEPCLEPFFNELAQQGIIYTNQLRDFTLDELLEKAELDKDRLSRLKWLVDTGHLDLSTR